MREPGQLQKFFTALKDIVASQPVSRFTCGDCARNAKCGLPPHDDCVTRLLQIRDESKVARKPDYLYPAIWPR